MIDTTTKQAIFRFEGGGWLVARNVGWGIFKITGASEDMLKYLDWSYDIDMQRHLVQANDPHIDLFDGKHFYFISREIVGIESLDDTWR